MLLHHFQIYVEITVYHIEFSAQNTLVIEILSYRRLEKWRCLLETNTKPEWFIELLLRTLTLVYYNEHSVYSRNQSKDDRRQHLATSVIINSCVCKHIDVEFVCNSNTCEQYRGFEFSQDTLKFQAKSSKGLYTS